MFTVIVKQQHNQSEVTEDFNSTYMDDLLNIDNNFLKAWSIIFSLQNFSLISKVNRKAMITN